ncbi:Ribosomal large subunit pseudouridine synthase C [Roseimaritima ulvae]|uniref:Ribosomal large subunit pseudouridine synthase C n=1 Tax=Roseimaritima ulvae TaxID=980254 RepID=A0A5B9QLC6_9BACT|nr:Ribosomal large subunit pseudouridine synthase C [Roseimaritima ulvae]
MDVLWEDATMLVVNKPSGVLSTGPANVPSLEADLQAWLQQRQSAAGKPVVRLVHRLDRPVSGALLVARTARAARVLSEQFQARMVDKRYLVMVEGRVDDPQGRWLDIIRKVPDQPRAELVGENVAGGKPAVLKFTVQRRWDDRTLLEIQLETGRMHQIRVQAASRGHAVLGDVAYGSQRVFGPQVTDPRQAAIALHSHRVAFRHPKTARPITVDAPLPTYW